jgi:hypothetical protein
MLYAARKRRFSTFHGAAQVHGGLCLYSAWGFDDALRWRTATNHLF